MRYLKQADRPLNEADPTVRDRVTTLLAQLETEGEEPSHSNSMAGTPTLS